MTKRPTKVNPDRRAPVLPPGRQHQYFALIVLIFGSLFTPFVVALLSATSSSWRREQAATRFLWLQEEVCSVRFSSNGSAIGSARQTISCARR